MTHEIFGERFFGHREPAWHKLGVVSTEPMSGIEALTAIGGGFWFDKRPVYVNLDGELKETESFALVRSALPDDPQERVMDYVTKQYNILQPLEAIEIFDQTAKQPVETLGMLGKGERMFVTWKLPSFEVTPGDEVKPYGFVALGFDALMGASLNVVTTRVVCANTWKVAISESERESKNGNQNLGHIWSGKHTSKNMGRDLSIWMEHIQERAETQSNNVANIFQAMANIPITELKVVSSLLYDIYPDPGLLPSDFPEKLRLEKQLVIDKSKEQAENDRDAVISLFDGEGTAIDATAWGLFNCVTEYENWGRTTRKPPENSILFGQRNQSMNRAAEVLYVYAMNQGK